MVSRREHAARLLADYPNALRFRAHAVRVGPVPASFAEGQPPTGRHPSRDLRELALSAADRRAAQRGRASGARHPGTRAESCSDSENGRCRSCELVEHGLTGVAIVAHSKGGIVGKHVMALDDRGTGGRVDRLVAIASPFNGSAMARLAPNPAARLSGRRSGHRGAGGRARGERAHHLDLPEFRSAHPRRERTRGGAEHRGAGHRTLPDPASAGRHRRGSRRGRRLSERDVERRV